jgi:hypothetical protein
MHRKRTRSALNNVFAIAPRDLRGRQGRRCAMPVTLINLFAVPTSKQDDFVKWWEEVKADITKQSGFISGKFHRSIKPDSRFNFIKYCDLGKRGDLLESL